MLQLMQQVVVSELYALGVPTRAAGEQQCGHVGALGARWLPTAI